MDVEVAIDGRPAGVTVAWAKNIVVKTLAHESKRANKVSVLLTGDKRIRQINKKYLKHDYATDVVAFSLNEGALLGDVVVSVEMARRAAKELKIPFKEELARYLVHGTLHLLGYEDKSRKQCDKMHKRQEKILDGILRRSRRISKRDPSSLRSSG